MEKAYRDFGHDIDNTDCPLEAGLGFALALDKPGGFVGREAVLARKEANAAAGGMAQRLVQVRVLDPEPLLFHAEIVHRDGVLVGYVRAASYGWTLGGAVGLAMVSGGGEPVTPDWLRGRVVGGRRRRRAAPGRGVAAADVRPHHRAGPRVSPVPQEVRLSRDGRELDLLVRRLGRRRLLGITGAPGVGKSTFAAAVAARVVGGVLVPMDGFHLADVELARRGLLDRKGAPETFDAWGYAALLGRVRRRADQVVMAPSFDRDLEQPLAGAIPVPSAAALVVTEGNYLLLEEPEWRAVRASLEEVWYLTLPDDLRRQRLVARHVAFGKTPDEARAWVERVDEPNARLVEACADRADAVIDVSAVRWPLTPGR